MVKPAERAVRQHVEHALPVQLDACDALEIPEAKGTTLIGGGAHGAITESSGRNRKAMSSLHCIGDTENENAQTRYAVSSKTIAFVVPWIFWSLRSCNN